MEPIYPNSHDNCTDAEDTFEHRFSTRSLRMLKIITPFLPEHIQPGLAAMIRMQELTHTLNCLRTLTPSSFVHASEKGKTPTSPHSLAELFQPDTLNRILQRLSPLLRPNERNELAKIQQMMQMFETYKQLEPLMSMFTEMNTNTNHTEESSGFSPEMLMSMLSPDMLQNVGPLMQMFGSGPNTETASAFSYTTDTDTTENIHTES